MDNKVENNYLTDFTKETLTVRIWKHKFHYLISIPAILFIIIMKYAPLYNALRLPFIDYKPVKGIVNSKWIGLDNFYSLFSQMAFPRIIHNSIILNAGFLLACSIVSFAVIWGLSGISSKRILGIFTTIFLIPLFIPSVVFSYWVFNTFLRTTVLMNPEYMRLIYICAQTLKYGGIPIILGVVAVRAENRLPENELSEFTKKRIKFIKPAAKIILAFSIIQLSSLLTNDFEMVSTLYNPAVYSTMDVLDTYIYRTGLMNFSFSISSTLGLIKLIIQVITMTAAYLLVRKLFRDSLFIQDGDENTDNAVKQTKMSLIRMIPVLLYAGIILYILFEIIIYPFLINESSNGNLSSIVKAMPKNAFYNHFFASLIATVINAFITIMMAYPLTAKKLPGRGFYKAFLIVALSVGTYTINEYILYSNLRMVNTFLPFIINGSFGITDIFVLKSIFNSKYSADMEAAYMAGKSGSNRFFTVYIPKIWRPMTALSILQFASCWGSFYTSMIFTRNREYFTPVLIFRESMYARSDKLPKAGEILLNVPVMQLGAVIAIVPVVLFLIFRSFFTSETFVGQIRK